MAAKKKIIEETADAVIEKKSKVKEGASTFDILDDLIQQQFDEVVDLSKVDGKVKNWYDTGIYALNYAMSKHLMYGIPEVKELAIENIQLKRLLKKLMVKNGIRKYLPIHFPTKKTLIVYLTMRYKK